MAAVAAEFDRDLEADFQRIGTLIRSARQCGARLLALPEACLGGYLADLHGGADPPPALRADGPEIARLAMLAGDMVVCAGFCEDAEGTRYNSVVCVSGDGVLGLHRKVHQPLRENASVSHGTPPDADAEAAHRESKEAPISMVRPTMPRLLGLPATVG